MGREDTGGGKPANFQISQVFSPLTSRPITVGLPTTPEVQETRREYVFLNSFNMPRTRSQIIALKNRKYQVLPPKNDISLFQKRGDCIEGLPIAIFLLVKSFLKSSDYRELMNCNLATFQPIKYETVEYNIVGPERWLPIDSVHDDRKKDFVKTLINSVKDKSKQISITMKCISTELFESSIDLFEGIYSFIASVDGFGVKPQRKEDLDFRVFNNIHTLSLSSLPVTSISGGLENVVRLELCNFPNLRFISNINSNKTLRRLTIKSCYSLTHLDFILEDIKTIHINCPYLTCLGGLRGDIEEITLSTAAQITLKTVNSLTEIAPKLKSLDVNCLFPYEFTDYHIFHSISTLRLPGNRNRAEQKPSLSPVFESKTLKLLSFDLTPWNNSHAVFDNLQDLELIYCSGIVTLPVISSLKTLKLNHLQHLKTIPTLMNLQMLHVNACGALVSISSVQPALMKAVIDEAFPINHISFDSPLIEEVSLCRCDGITDLSTLKNIPKLWINNCAGITSLEGLGGSSLQEDRRIIDLKYLRNVHDTSGLHHIHSLKISNMTINSDISDINHLDLTYCKLSTTKDLKNIRNSLTLVRCDQLTKLENLQGIPLIEIIRCSKIDCFDGLKNDVLFGEVRACLYQHHFESLRARQNQLNIQTLTWINPNTKREIIYSLP